MCVIQWHVSRVFTLCHHKCRRCRPNTEGIAGAQLRACSIDGDLNSWKGAMQMIRDEFGEGGKGRSMETCVALYLTFSTQPL
jgi:hypothetical protein